MVWSSDRHRWWVVNFRANIDKYRPAFLIADWTRSRLSWMAVSGNPTIVIVGSTGHTFLADFG
jgi:hypothetical protein